MNIEKLMNWVQEGKGRRSVTIEIGDPNNADYLNIWTYDYDLGKGQHLKTFDEEIKLYELAREEELKELKRLQEKYKEEI